MKFCCVNVPGGWQTGLELPNGNTEVLGPTFNKVNDLWAWQKANLYQELTCQLN